MAVACDVDVDDGDNNYEEYFIGGGQLDGRQWRRNWLWGFIVIIN